MRNLIVILVLSLTVFATTRAVGMSLSHADSALVGAMVAIDGPCCPSCPEAATGDPAGQDPCGDCAACGVVVRETRPPVADPVAMTFSRVVSRLVASRPASRADTEDPPPPRH